MTVPRPAPLVEAVPAATPFVAPEALARAAGRDTLLRLGANESAFGPSPRAVAAMTAELERTSFYGDPESLELRTALAERHRASVGEIVVGSGIDDLLGLTVRTFCAPGDVCVATRGTYPTFAYQVAGYGARLEAASPREDGSLDVDAVVRAARQTGAAIVYVANPDNPSGSFAEAGELARLRGALPDRTLLLLDEAYADFVPPARLPPDAIDPRTIRMRTFSKAYGLAGARIAYALASRETIAAFDKIRLHFGVNRLAQIAALASLGDPEFVRAVVREVDAGREDYYRLAAAHGRAALRSHTNFVCIDIGSRAAAEAMVRTLLELGVFIRKPGAPPLDRFVRITVGTPEERRRFEPLFAEALERSIEKAAR